MMKRLFVAIVLNALFVAGVFAAEPAVIEGARKEGSLVFYTTMDIQNSKPLLDAFMQKISI